MSAAEVCPSQNGAEENSGDRLTAKLGTGLLAAGLFLIPLNVYVLLGPLGQRAEFGPVFLFEAFLLLSLPFYLATIRGAWARIPQAIRWWSGGLVAIVTLSLLFNPSLGGATHTVRLGMMGAVAVAIIGVWHRAPKEILIPLCGGCVAQVFVGLMQWNREGPVGLEALGEGPSFIYFGDSMAIQGTFPHPYVLAGFCMATLAALAVYLMKESPGPRWLAIAALVAIPLGLTYSRMTILGICFFLLLGFVGTHGKRSLRLFFVVVLIGFALPATLDASGWIDRAARSSASLSTGTSDSKVEAFTSGRLTFLRQALDVLDDNPLVGVGPKLYLHELEDRGYSSNAEQLYQVHLVPLLIAVESGSAAGLCALMLLALLALHARDLGLVASGSFLSFIPFVLLDHFPYSQPQGMASATIWGATLIAASSTPAQTTKPSE